VLRANRALGIWFRRAARGGVVEVVSPALSQEARHLIAARLPGLMGEGEGRSGVERLEEGNLAFVAADDIQVGVLMPPRVPTTTAIRDLEGVIAAIRTKDFLEVISSRTPSAGESVASIAVRLALEAERLLEAEVAVAIRRPRGAQVVGTALRADPHLHRVTAAPGSPVDLCVRGEVDAPMMVFEPLGLLPWDRRHRERKAFVMPIKARTGPVGALVVWTVHGAEPTGPNRAELKRAVHRSALLFEDALHRLQLVEEATRDPLTGLVNRRGLEAAMGTMDVERGALVCIDLDHFKTLNDTLGHPAGDAALGFVSRVILDTVRDRDTAARIGGEEFAVWLPGTPLDEATRVAERLRTRIAGRAWGWQGRPWPITASFGVAGWPEGTNSRENLFQLADQALYRAKQAGRNRVEVWGEERKGVGLGT
jgi:diguanylate cyclase (GGDEF)-like protein